MLLQHQKRAYITEQWEAQLHYLELTPTHSVP